MNSINDKNEQGKVQDVAAVDPNVTGKAIVDLWHTLGDGDSKVHAGLVMSAALLIELAEDCEAGEWYFDADEVRPSRLHVDAIGKALACIEKRLRQDEAQAALPSLSAEEIGALIGVACTHRNMMKVQNPDAETTAEYSLLQRAVQKLQAGQEAAQ